MAVRLDRDDLIDGLRDLISRVQKAGIRAVSIDIVGGAALRLAYFDRATTVDIDARLEPESELAPIIRAIATERAWPESWLNSDAAQFVPRWGRDPEWKPLLSEHGVTVSVASPETLLAMKLHAVQHRGNRDIADVAKLLRLVGNDTVDDAEQLYGEFYPGDEFTPRTYERIERIFAVGLPVKELPPLQPF
jgi:hypothetical protein